MDQEQGTLATPTPPALVIATTGATLALELAHTLAETLVSLFSSAFYSFSACL